MKDDGNKFRYKWLFKTIIPAFFPALGVYFFFNMSFGNPNSGKVMFWPLWMGLGLFMWWYYKADSLKRMWFRTLATLSVMAFTFPFTILIFGGRQISKQTDSLTSAGTAIGTGIAFVFFAVVGILLGLAFSISAYFVRKSLKSKS